MRTFKHAIFAVVLIVGFAAMATAGDTDKAKESEAPQELKNQTNCPVMGGKIDSTIYTDIQGQRVYHCCPMCSPKLKADPDKYFKKAAEEGVLFENIQTTCPVSGKKLEDKSIYTDYEGRRIVFCCLKCLGTFSENPEKYLEKLDEGSDASEAQSMDNMKNMDHSETSGHDQ